jgi:hypothetical protein
MARDDGHLRAPQSLWRSERRLAMADAIAAVIELLEGLALPGAVDAVIAEVIALLSGLLG